jgi:ABC-type antimicrobial peptide transport system permease subunit
MTILLAAVASVSLLVGGIGIMNITTRLSPESIVLAVGFSAAIGIFFGFYPARKASQLLPIQALRYE